MRKTLEKNLFPFKSTVMEFEMHYEKYDLLKQLLYYIAITCQKLSFALFLYFEIFWPNGRHFLPLFGNIHWLTFLKRSICILSTLEFRIDGTPRLLIILFFATLANLI